MEGEAQPCVYMPTDCASSASCYERLRGCTKLYGSVTYLVGNRGPKKIVRNFFSETALLQRSSTAPLKTIHTASHFLRKVHMNIA